MTQKTRKFFLLASLLLCFVLAAVLLIFGAMARYLQFLFVPYQFFLIGVCVGALMVAMAYLIVERSEWTSHYRVYFLTVMASAFLLVVINAVVFRVLGGEQFIQRLIRVVLVVLQLR